MIVYIPIPVDDKMRKLLDRNPFVSVEGATVYIKTSTEVMDFKLPCGISITPGDRDIAHIYIRDGKGLLIVMDGVT